MIRFSFLPTECPSRIAISAILFFYSAAWYHLFPIHTMFSSDVWRHFCQSISWHNYFEWPRDSQFHTQHVWMYCMLCCIPAFKLITASCNLFHGILYAGSYLVKKFQFASSDDKFWSLNTLSVDILFWPPWTFGARYSPQLNVSIPWTVLFRKCSILIFWP